VEMHVVADVGANHEHDVLVAVDRHAADAAYDGAASDAHGYANRCRG